MHVFARCRPKQEARDMQVFPQRIVRPIQRLHLLARSQTDALPLLCCRLLHRWRRLPLFTRPRAQGGAAHLVRRPTPPDGPLFESFPSWSSISNCTSRTIDGAVDLGTTLRCSTTGCHCTNSNPHGNSTRDNRKNTHAATTPSPCVAVAANAPKAANTPDAPKAADVANSTICGKKVKFLGCK